MKLNNQLKILGINGLAYSDMWNKIIKKKAKFAHN